VTAIEQAGIAPATTSPTAAERAALEACVRDYYESWYTGDRERMARALHPALAKRSFGQERPGTPMVEDINAQQMIDGAAAGDGIADAGPKLDIHIAEVGGGIASVNVFADHYVDLLHMIETPDGWRIINALWRYTDGHGPRA
jgi:hypothetical protein